MKGWSEEYGPLVLPEWALYIGPALSKSGRNVSIEAAMMPRFLSNLVPVSAAAYSILGLERDAHSEDSVDQVCI